MRSGGAVAVRLVDVSRPVTALDDVQEYERVRIYAQREGRLLGFAEVRNHGAALSARRVREALVDALGVRLIAADPATGTVDALIDSLVEELIGEDRDSPRPADDKLDPGVSVSIVIATFDRPDDLRKMLVWIREQRTERSVEIVLVDNHPSSGITPAVTAGFPDVVLVQEPRQGLAYARNAGILASTGDIIVMTDDDVRPPPDWLETLIAPLARNDVGAVTGNVLPLELETSAQRIFEIYGGLGRGFERREVDLRWFNKCKWVVPTWTLGASANAAFRSSLFRDPKIGLMHEALGPGMPSGVGEDTYLFYRILKAGYTMIYDPNAYVWHRHRTDMESLRAQLYGYSKGHVAYHLTTLLEDHDLRALAYLTLRLPFGQSRRILKRLRRKSAYPLKLSMVEIGGQLAGPGALWKSRRRVAREGRSSRRFGPIEEGIK